MCRRNTTTALSAGRWRAAASVVSVVRRGAPFEPSCRRTGCRDILVAPPGRSPASRLTGLAQAVVACCRASCRSHLTSRKLGRRPGSPRSFAVGPQFMCETFIAVQGPQAKRPSSADLGSADAVCSWPRPARNLLALGMPLEPHLGQLTSLSNSVVLYRLESLSAPVLASSAWHAPDLPSCDNTSMTRLQFR